MILFVRFEHLTGHPSSVGADSAGVAYRAYLPAADADPLRPQRAMWHFVGTAAGAVEAISLIPYAVPYAIPAASVPPDGPSGCVRPDRRWGVSTGAQVCEPSDECQYGDGRQ